MYGSVRGAASNGCPYRDHEWHCRSLNHLVSKELSPAASHFRNSLRGFIIKLSLLPRFFRTLGSKRPGRRPTIHLAIAFN